LIVRTCPEILTFFGYGSFVQLFDNIEHVILMLEGFLNIFLKKSWAAQILCYRTLV